MIVNPASSFANSPWPQLGPLLANAPPEVYRFLPFALAPIMANPLTMAMNDVDERAPLPQQASELLYVSVCSTLAAVGPVSHVTQLTQLCQCSASPGISVSMRWPSFTHNTQHTAADKRPDIITDPESAPPASVAVSLQGLVDMLPQLPALRLVLPPETLSWRLQLIQQGIDWMKPRYKEVKQRALVLGSDRDMLIPSGEEAERLRKALPRARSRCVQEGASGIVLGRGPGVSRHA